MDIYEILAVLVLSLFLIPIGYVVLWVVSIIRSPKMPPLPPVESEPLTLGELTLTITYRKGARPAQSVIDGIKGNIAQYEAMISAHVQQTEEYQDDFKAGIKLEGISFPVYDDETDYDFCFEYGFGDNSDMFLEVYFKDGKVHPMGGGMLKS